MKGRGHDLDDEKFTKGERSGTSFEIKWGGGETGEYFDGRVQALTFEKWKVSPQVLLGHMGTIGVVSMSTT